MALHTKNHINFDLPSGVYAWMILCDEVDSDIVTLTLIECLAALYVKGAQADLYFLENDTQQYQLLILRHPIVESKFISVFLSLVKHLNTISYGSMVVHENLNFNDFIRLCLYNKLNVQTNQFYCRQAEGHEKLAYPQSNYARYLRDQMGKKVLARLTC